jgi:type I restriction enzyme, S subunit
VREWSDLPSSWVIAPLESLAEINPRPMAVPESDASLVHFVPMRAVAEEFGGIDVSERRPLGEVRKGYTGFQAKDVLFAKITPCMENGKLALVPELQNGVGFGSTEFHVVRARPGVTPRWLAHFFSQSEFRKFARRHMTGTAGQLRVATPWLSATSLPVAPVTEQIRIVDKLEELLSDLDAGVAELKAAQKKLAQYRQSLLKAAVGGRLTEAWRAQHGEPEETGAQLLARILRERRTRWEAKQLAKFETQGKAPPVGWKGKYEEPASVDARTLPELPKGWIWARAEQLCDFITKGTTPPKGLDGLNKTVPFLRVTNLTSDGTLDLGDKVFVSEQTHRGFLARSAVYPGDVLMNIVGPPLGQVSVVPATFAEWNINQAIAIFRSVSGVSSRFMSLCLLSASAQAWLAAKAKTTAGQTNLTLEVCRDLPVALPPLTEQHEIAQAIDSVFIGLLDQEATIAAALRRSAAQRKNILQAAFSGRLVPQDPADEPASVLLERIRAERAAQAAGVNRPSRGRRRTAAA